MKPSRFLAAAVAGLFLLAACGNDDEDPTAADPTGQTTDDTGADGTNGTGDGDANDGDAPVTTAETDLGSTLVAAESGLTLYGFLPDSGGEPTCFDSCADAWPPLFVDSETLPEGLDSEVFSVVEYQDGRFQLAAGGWPLYTFASDAAAGDVNGQGVGDNWYAAAPDGTLIGAPEQENATSNPYDY